MRIILRTMDLPGKSAALYRPRKSPIMDKADGIKRKLYHFESLCRAIGWKEPERCLLITFWGWGGLGWGLTQIK